MTVEKVYEQNKKPEFFFFFSDTRRLRTSVVLFSVAVVEQLVSAFCHFRYCRASSRNRTQPKHNNYPYVHANPKI